MIDEREKRSIIRWMEDVYRGDFVCQKDIVEIMSTAVERTIQRHGINKICENAEGTEYLLIDMLLEMDRESPFLHNYQGTYLKERHKNYYNESLKKF